MPLESPYAISIYFEITIFIISLTVYVWTCTGLVLDSNLWPWNLRTLGWKLAGKLILATRICAPKLALLGSAICSRYISWETSTLPRSIIQFNSVGTVWKPIIIVHSIFVLSQHLQNINIWNLWHWKLRLRSLSIAFAFMSFRGEQQSLQISYLAFCATSHRFRDINIWNFKARNLGQGHEWYLMATFPVEPVNGKYHNLWTCLIYGKVRPVPGIL